jgi:hypothetical protein
MLGEPVTNPASAEKQGAKSRALNKLSAKSKGRSARVLLTADF